MQRVASIAVLFTAAMLVTAAPSPSRAEDAPSGRGATCAPRTGICTVEVTTAPGTDRPRSPDDAVNRAVSVRSRSPRPSIACSYELENPQPPKSDSIWVGHTGGGIYAFICPGDQDFVAIVWRATQVDGASAPAPTAAELAQEALAELRLPKPTIHRSPSELAVGDEGVPYTWVNLWTWYWTTSQSWRDLSKTASLGAVYATVTVSPQELILHPGDGSPDVSCDGPGRPWTEADGNAAPSGGGCGYVYRSVSEGVRSRLSIRWAVTWVGSGGAQGTLPDMTTQTISPAFRVEQQQEVNL